VSQEVDGETLLYVEATHQASCLNGSAARIWALCDGERSVGAIAAVAKAEPEVVAQALKQLGEAGLLENAGELPPSVDLTRRRVLLGSLAAIPVILILTVPGAAAAASCQPAGPCTIGGPNCCNTGSACPPIGQICS
jgi:hypothetical protein